MKFSLPLVKNLLFLMATQMGKYIYMWWGDEE